MVFSKRSRGGYPPDDADGDDDLEFEPIILSQPRRRTGLWLALFGLVALGGAAGGGWYFLDEFLGESVDTSVPLIRADIAPIKVRPESPGGMQVPDQDKLVYDRMQGEGEAPQVEQLLPPPETPLPLPAPPPPPQVDVAPEVAPATEAEVAEAAIAEATQPPPPSAPPAQPAPPGPISLVPEQPAPPSPPKPAEAVEKLLPEPVKPNPVKTATAAPPKPVEPPPKPVEAPPPPKPVETKPAPRPAKPPAKPETTVAGKPPKPAPSPPKKAVKPTRAYQIQIAAVRSPSRAEGEWKRIQRKHRDLLGKLKLSIIKADLGPKKGIYYRLRAGPVADETAARSLCATLKKRKVGCLIVAPKG